MATAEALMRSRFTAFALGREDWLSTSWHPDTRPSPPLLSQPPLKWIDLKVLRHDQTTVDSAQVEFVARFRDQGRAGRLHENSRFLRVEAQWLYVDGEIRENPRGRIDTPAPPQTSLRAKVSPDDTRTFADKTS